jgi:hypothetical protein
MKYFLGLSVLVVGWLAWLLLKGNATNDEFVANWNSPKRQQELIDYERLHQWT